MRYETFYTERDYDSFCAGTKIWEKKLRDAFYKEPFQPPQKYPAILIWEMIWWNSSNAPANFSYLYIYRDSQLIKDLFSELKIGDNLTEDTKKEHKKKKL